MGFLSSSDALHFAVRSCCVTRFILLIELAVVAKEMRPGGIFNWDVLSLVDHSRNSKIRFYLAQTFGRIAHKTFVIMLFLEASIVVAAFTWPSNAALVLAAAAFLLIHLKRHYLSFNGSDQMVFVVLVAVFIGSIGHAARAATAFLAAEVSISYLVAGVYKVWSPYWKHGTALKLIVQTQMFGNQTVARLLNNYGWLTVVSQSTVVFWECSFFIALVAPPRAVMVILGAGVIFHAACAWMMGLNTFPWAFWASYPAIIVCNRYLRSLLTPVLADEISAVFVAIVVFIFILGSVLVKRKTGFKSLGIVLRQASQPAD